MPLISPSAASAAPDKQSRECARDMESLIVRLSDADATVRRWAARDLAAYPQAATALCASLCTEIDTSVRAVLFSSAAGLGNSVVVDTMLGLLRSEDAGLRNGAIEILAHLPDAVEPHIEHLLKDADSDVRIFAVNLLGDLNHRLVPHWLGQVLVAEQEINVVGAALEVLAEVGTPAELPSLHAVAQRFPDDAYISFAVDVAIVRIVTP